MTSVTASQPSVPVLLDQAAAARPGAVAVVDEQGSHTYAELAGRVNHLASQVASAGAGLEDRVGVSMRPSAGLLAAVLAVMRAGAAYVPIDPAYPAERQRFLAADAGIKVLIGEDGAGDVLADDLADVRLLRPDAGMAARCDLPYLTGPGHLACVIYTSGSTGVPKGTMITCRGLANLAAAAAGTFALGPGDRYLMLASPSFSASLEELFPPLAAGAAAVFPPDREALSSAAELLDFVEAHAVTLAELQTTQWHLLVRYLTETGRRPPSSLRLVVMGGERPLPDAFGRWRASGLPLVHVYGPTETTATATYAGIDPAAPADGPMPIGRAIPGVRLFVVGARGDLAAPGTPGELYIGGDALARGYLGRPGATAERFVPDPFSGEPGAVLYRTGDLVQQRPDGQLVFLERVDHQVKVRGYRVEPIEVEQALERHPAVTEAVVVAREDVPGHRRLVAYFTGGETTPAELRRFLASRLPGYMIPSAFVPLRELPLTPHRKIDRAALPAPARQRPDLGTPFVPPGDPVEEDLCALWASLLRIDEVGVTDDFLALGGDSLLTLRLITKIESRFGIRLTPRQAFAERTVRGLATLLRDRVGAVHEDTAGLRERRLELAAGYARRHGRPVTGPASAVQHGMWLLSRLLPDSPVNNTPWQCRLRGRLDRALLRRALSALVDRHEVLSAAFPEIDGEILQVPAGEVSIEEIDLREAADARDRAREYAAELGRRPFDVTAGPLLRLAVISLADDDHLLVWGVHHLIIDLRSQQVLLQELADIYQALNGGGEVPPEPAVQYADLSADAHSPGRQRGRERSLEFWRREFAGLPALPLPVTGTASGYDGADYRFWLPAALADGAAALGQETGTSMFMVLITAYAAFVHRWTGSEDFAIVTPLAGRNDPRAADAVGLFTVTGALRFRLRPGLSFRELLARTRTGALAAYDHQDVSLDQVTEVMGRRDSYQRFRVLFSLQTDSTIGLAWPGIAVEPIEDLPTGTTRLDVSLIFHQRPDGVYGRFEYRAGLMDEATAIDLAGQYCEVLAAVLADPGRPPGRPDGAAGSSRAASAELSGARP